ncbi:hypothetical protein ARC20_04325 [Stenotrophomonas panacihumi]|uniref:Uncharacterized protein n=1 Tax=Stenotrophomonas panacihumi TaxID=676599 RepID=A0A0R0AZZ5_9GAMM|nr:hypothetical protein [Stenotrophomonas panacihumi]KRG46900.1 hypothetical protein ARC20_04325 [Stenotrophomonas panacihumi]PTN56032.1 hypothetical protein C9J98_02900 [Stenotrophomonas panacihumi]
MRKGIRIALASVLMLLAVSSMASSRSQRRILDEVQAAYAAAVRWNDFDTAQEMLDPEYRKDHPQSDLERARYEQVQISGYRELRAGNGATDNEVFRDVELRVINRNTQAERTVRVRETWRWDPEAKQWWLASGLPDLWRGE